MSDGEKIKAFDQAAMHIDQAIRRRGIFSYDPLLRALISIGECAGFDESAVAEAYSKEISDYARRLRP